MAVCQSWLVTPRPEIIHAAAPAARAPTASLRDGCATLTRHHDEEIDQSEGTGRSGHDPCGAAHGRYADADG